LSTALCRPLGKHRQGSRVVRTDDIHTLVENGEEHPQDRDETAKSARKPPGQFISDELEAETARFIEEVKGLARRRKEVASEPKPGLPPPPSGGDQRSRRR
jgi:hypothetical protein